MIVTDPCSIAVSFDPPIGAYAEEWEEDYSTPAPEPPAPVPLMDPQMSPQGRRFRQRTLHPLLRLYQDGNGLDSLQRGSDAHIYWVIENAQRFEEVELKSAAWGAAGAACSLARAASTR